MGKCYASKVVAWAKAQVGTKETPMGSNKNPYSEYIDKNFPDFYNGKKNGIAWCDQFVDCGMLKCFGETDALRLTCQPKHSAGAGVKYSYQYYKSKKQTSKTPKIGSQIFFGKTEATLSHTGLVVGIDKDGTIHTVEGNKGNKVSDCKYKKGDSSIFGYGHPKYDDEPKKEESKTEVKPSTSTKPQTTSYKVTAPSGLRLRKGAGTDYPIVVVMPYKSTFKVTKTYGSWAYGTYGTKTGWASLSWLSKI